MSIESTRKIMQQYFDSHHIDVSVMTQDMVFTVMGTGQDSRSHNSEEWFFNRSTINPKSKRKP